MQAQASEQNVQCTGSDTAVNAKFNLQASSRIHPDVPNEEIDAFRATLSMKEADIKRRRMTQHKLSKEADIALQIIDMKQRELKGIPDDFIKPLADLDHRHRYEIGEHIINSRKAAELKRKHDEERHAAIAALKAEEDAKALLAKHATLAAAASVSATGAADGDDTHSQLQAAPTKKRKKSLFDAPSKILDDYTQEELLQLLDSKFPPVPYVLLNVHKGVGIFPYDMYVLEGADEATLRAIDAALQHTCACTFNAVFWNGIIAKYKKLRLTVERKDKGAALGALAARFPKMDIRHLAWRTLIWPQ